MSEFSRICFTSVTITAIVIAAITTFAILVPAPSGLAVYPFVFVAGIASAALALGLLALATKFHLLP